MHGETLERKIARIGSPVRMLRNAPQGAYEFPMPAEYSNWRDEQRARLAADIGLGSQQGGRDRCRY